MPLTKQEMIPSTRTEMTVLQELVDNRRMIRAREYERNRRKITQYEKLEDAQKPLINVIKGLFEDHNTWDVNTLADGTVVSAPLSWQNISPLLRQLNSMTREEAIETLNDAANKLPNSLTQKKGNIQKLAAVFAKKPKSEGNINIDDLDREGLISVLGATRLSTRRPPDVFHTPTTTPLGSPRREHPGAGDAAPAPPMAGDSAPAPMAGDSAPPPPPPPPPIAGDAAPPPPHYSDRIRDDLGSEVEQFASHYRDNPDMLTYLADLARFDKTEVDYLIGEAERISEAIEPGQDPLSDSTVRGMRGSIQGIILEQMIENLWESENSNPYVSDKAERKLQTFREAYEMVDELRDSQIKDTFIRRFGTLPEVQGTIPFTRLVPPPPTAIIPPPYREGAVGITPLIGMVKAIESGAQPFRAGLPIPSGGQPSPAMGTLETARAALSSPTAHYVPTLPTDSPSASLQHRVDEIRSMIPPSDLELIKMDEKELESKPTHPKLSTVYTSAAAGESTPTTISHSPDGAINLMNVRLSPESITPTSITYGRKTIKFSPTVWKILTLNDPRSIELLDVRPIDEVNIERISKLLHYKGWNTQNSKFRAVARELIPRKDISMTEQIASTRRELSRGRMPKGASTRGRKPYVSAEERTADLEEGVLPSAWQLRGLSASGEGMKKWSPLKLGSSGELGDIEVSLPDLLNRLELIVKRREGGKVMLRKKGVPLDLVRLLTRRYNPKVSYSDEAKNIYKKIITLAKIPLGKTYSQKEYLMGSGLLLPTQSTSSKIIAEADPDRVVSSFMTDLGTFKNGNRSKILKNTISEKADFLLENDLISDEEHKLIHNMILSKGRKLSADEAEFLNELFS